MSVKETLYWYAKHVGNCRKMTTEGQDSRNALDKDCGERARLALAVYFCPDCKGRGIAGQFNSKCGMCAAARLALAQGKEAFEAYAAATKSPAPAAAKDRDA